MSMKGFWRQAGLSALVVAVAGQTTWAEPLPSNVEGIPVPALDEAFTPDLSTPPALAEAPATVDSKDITGAIEALRKAPEGGEPAPSQTAMSALAAAPAPDVTPAAAPAAEQAKTEQAKTEQAKTEEAKPNPVAVALAGLLTDDGARLFTDTRDLEAVKLFYASRGNAPLFAEGTGFSAKAEAALAQLKAASEDGIELPALAREPLNARDAGAQAASELRLLASTLHYARLISGGQINPGKVHALITTEPQRLDPRLVLEQLAKATDIRAAMSAFAPPQDGYKRLKAKLAEIHAAGDKPKLEADIIANMERWRWMPRDMGKVHILVNIPAYEASINADGQQVHKTRVIVGKPTNPTPVFSENMQYAVINPSWSVPYSIIKKEMLPKAQARGASAFAGMEVLVRGRVVDASSVDWSKTSSISVRQPPSERNALGRIKFLFPNRHSVYLHDTPNRSLFANAKRAYSHGCVRVYQPEAFGEVLFRYANPGDNWTETRFRSLYGKGERRVDLKQKIPVHIAYFTLSVDENGNLVEFEDIYRFNEDTKLALFGQTKTARNGLISP